MMNDLDLCIHLNESYDQAIEQVMATLKTQGFGILMRADVHKTFKETMGIEFPPYTMLRVCKPSIAHRMLSHNPQMGVLLPCGITVEANAAGGSLVRIGRLDTLIKAVELDEDEEMQAIANEACEHLDRLAHALAPDKPAV